ncbi:hypothetical protein EVAR_12716_1 [Eumeta japonica]|uniref:Uncharacterized protein n=1 Tax=Eumeta variegata TaxID=151549 RepID=A0A4C1UNY2_EUMVA|nr:hypothetical protein EVAR_12716_1 [Eumeta japonica]
MTRAEAAGDGFMAPYPVTYTLYNCANENQQPNNTLINEPKDQPKFKHHRTISLPADCMQFQEPLRICHERTRSAPLTGDEVDHAAIDKVARHSSCKAVNGIDFTKKHQWPRRASIGAKLTKLSPAHTKNSLSVIRNRCDSMPSRACPREMEPDGTPATHVIENKEGGEPSRDETDSAEWHKTPRIPEEPDAAYFEMTPGGIIDDNLFLMTCKTDLNAGRVEHGKRHQTDVLSANAMSEVKNARACGD